MLSRESQHHCSLFYFIPFSLRSFPPFLSQKMKVMHIDTPYISLKFGSIGENPQDFVEYLLKFLGVAGRLGAELSCVYSFLPLF